MPSLHAYEIDSDRPLARLSGAPGPMGTIIVREAESSPLDEAATLGHMVIGRDERPAYALARTAGGVIAWHADAGSFALDPAGLSIRYRPADATRPFSETRWGDRLGSTAVPLLAAERDHGVVLHASANLIGDRALLVCGITGRGKSTLAAALAAAGWPLLAEDGVVVRDHGEPRIWPGLTGALITDEAAAGLGRGLEGERESDPRGRRLRPGVPLASGPASIGAVVVLMERGGSELRIREIERAKAHRELLAQVVAVERLGPRAFAASARLASRVPVALVALPDRLEALDDAAKRLAAWAGSDSVLTQSTRGGAADEGAGRGL